jgi:hypothetical protein
MATLPQLMKVRRDALKVIEMRMRALDTIQEYMERFIDRILARRKKLPTSGDLDSIVAGMRSVDKAVDQVIGAVDKARVTFTKSIEIVDKQIEKGETVGMTVDDFKKLRESIVKFIENIPLPTTGRVKSMRLK